MKNAEYNSLGIKVNFSVPESVDEFDQNAKRAGACLDEATNNVIYRGSLAEFRDLFLHGRPASDGVAAFKGLDEVSGIPRKTKTIKKGDKEVEEFDETEGEYMKRVCAEQNKKAEDFQDLANAAAALIPFDASAKERKAPEPKTLPTKFKDSAKQVLAKYDDNQIEKNAKKFAPDWKHDPFVRTGDEAKDLETLGWFLKEFDKNRPVM